MTGPDEAQEAELAALVGVAAPPPGVRVRSLRFTRGAEEWTAAVVQTILPADDGYVVVTDAPPVGPVDDSTWDNPVRVPGRDVREIAPY